jgi:lysophosphatidate acyltransferase
MAERSIISSWLLFLLVAFEQACIRISSLIKLIIGWTFMFLAFLVLFVVLIVCLPNRLARIKACNHFGTVVGHFFIWLSGCPLTVTGAEHLDSEKPAIFASNHTSVLDIFLAIWLSPTGTVGVAKKQIIYYPFFGILYALSGHLRINRGNSKEAIASMKELGQTVKKHSLSVFIWPEGTRSRTGRLLPFKKGIVNLAIQSGLPVVPFVVTGAYKSWEPRTHTICKVPIRVDVLAPIDTKNWSVDRIDEALEEIHECFRKTLPRDQLPL